MAAHIYLHSNEERVRSADLIEAQLSGTLDKIAEACVNVESRMVLKNTFKWGFPICCNTCYLLKNRHKWPIFAR